MPVKSGDNTISEIAESGYIFPFIIALQVGHNTDSVYVLEPF